MSLRGTFTSLCFPLQVLKCLCLSLSLIILCHANTTDTRKLITEKYKKCMTGE